MRADDRAGASSVPRHARYPSPRRRGEEGIIGQDQIPARYGVWHLDEVPPSLLSQSSLSLPPLSCRPSTPVFDLLEHRYGERWLEERREAERKQRQKNNKKVTLNLSLAPSLLWIPCAQKLQGKVYETRASLMRRYSEPVDPPPLWKMKRWQQVRGNSLFDSNFSIAFFSDWTDADYIQNGRGEICCLPSPRIRRCFENWCVWTRHIPGCQMLASLSPLSNLIPRNTFLDQS